MNFCKNFEFYQSSKVSVSGLDLERTILIVKFLLYEQFVAFVYLWTGLKQLKLEIANLLYFEKATQNLTSKDLFMSFTTVFWDEICYDFYWEKKPVLDQYEVCSLNFHPNITSENIVPNSDVRI